MKNWTEFHIGVVYYCGLLISLIIGIGGLMYLKPLSYIKKIVSKHGSLWTNSFVTTIIMAGTLGAMSVSFRDCSCSYDNLLTSKSTTIYYGLSQISSGCMAYAILLGAWLIILITIKMIYQRNISHLYKVISITLVIAGIWYFYQFKG